ncbi:hypothetical protein AB0873_19665 [Micromonospora sp. NPDC047707]|uniref:hypothetical protein n=1 Tax=Micromonospora sp. NPDC047707 TaxID=3154498 RepID=UPI003455D259
MHPQQVTTGHDADQAARSSSTGSRFTDSCSINRAAAVMVLDDVPVRGLLPHRGDVPGHHVAHLPCPHHAPTKGFLSGAEGPFAGIYHDLAGTAFANWAFLLGLLGIGLALTLGIGMRIAAATGATLYVMMWSVALPPQTNPFLDEHLTLAAVLVGLTLIGPGRTLGLGATWEKLPIVQRFPWLR